jgi:phosphatidylglycerophosphate synthase
MTDITDRTSAAPPRAMPGGSWTHIAARWMVRPLVGTWVTPNHLTTLRLLTGLAACALFAMGGRSCEIWGGIVWVISAFLDRADGELARIGGKTSARGHLYDFYTDVLVSGLFFVAIGVGLQESWLGGWALALGILAGGSIAVCDIVSEELERRDPSGKRAYSGAWGFDLDDLMYLFGPFAWLDWLLPLLIGASIGGVAFLIATSLRLVQAIRGRG